MKINRTLLLTETKIHLSNLIFFLVNIFHVVLVSTSTLETHPSSIVQFKIHPFINFNTGAFITLVVIMILQIFISYLFMFRVFSQAKLSRLTELGLNGGEDEKLTKNLRINPRYIYNWVYEQAREQNIRSIKRIYLTDTSIPNAFTMDVIPFPFIRCTWIVLDANVLEILDERELKAVISHELGHVKRLDGIVNIFRFGLNYFVFISYGLFILTIIYHTIIEQPVIALNIALKICYLIFVIVILSILTLFNRFLMNYSRRHSELIADYYAGKQVGRNHIINALILLGQRLDVVSAFGTEFRWLGSLEGKENLTREFIQGLKSLPPLELSKEITREKAVQIYISQRLKNLRDDLFIPLTDTQIDELTKVASEKLLKLREDTIENGLVFDHQLHKELFKLTIDWLLVDKDNDLYLSDEEIESLIKTMRKNPKKELFEEDLHKRKLIIGTDHPSMKERIFFLYNVFQ